jgi:peptide/nickel transport system permease protein
MLLALPLGVLTARHKGSWFDRGVLVAATLSLSLPAFWLARMLQYWFSYKLGWFPIAGFRSPASLVLPASTLALLFVGFTPASFIPTWSKCSIARLCVLPARKAPPKRECCSGTLCATRPIPVTTMLAMDCAALLGGVIFTENVFALPGIGTLAVQSVFNLDVPMIMGTVLFSGTLVVTANLVVDLVYGWIDPRIKRLFLRCFP